MFGLRRIAFICYLVGRSDATVGRSDATLGRSDAAPQKSYRIVGATRRAAHCGASPPPRCVAHCGASPPVMHRPGAAVPRPKNPAQPYRRGDAVRRPPRGASPTRRVSPKKTPQPYIVGAQRCCAPTRRPGKHATAHDGGAIIWPGANSGAQEAGRLPPRLPLPIPISA